MKLRQPFHRAADSHRAQCGQLSCGPRPAQQQAHIQPALLRAEGAPHAAASACLARGDHQAAVRAAVQQKRARIGVGRDGFGQDAYGHIGQKHGKLRIIGHNGLLSAVDRGAARAV